MSIAPTSRRRSRPFQRPMRHSFRSPVARARQKEIRTKVLIFHESEAKKRGGNRLAKLDRRRFSGISGLRANGASLYGFTICSDQWPDSPPVAGSTTQQRKSGVRRAPTPSGTGRQSTEMEKTNGESTPPAITSFSPARSSASSVRKWSPMGSPLTIVPSVLQRSRT